MLDLDDPKSNHIFQAARLMDRVMQLGQKMSVSPSEVRRMLLDESKAAFDDMRQLSRDHFTNQPQTILNVVDEYEAALKKLAGLGNYLITEDRRDGTGRCPVCNTKITNVRGYNLVVCGQCDDEFMAAHEKLDSDEGFGTWAI